MLGIRGRTILAVQVTRRSERCCFSLLYPMSKPEQEPASCPLCGGAAVRGCLYTADQGGLSWFNGEASWFKNLASGFGAGEPVGEAGLFKGCYMEGIRCLSCRRVVMNC